MKRIQTLLMMCSLFFLFSFSSAETLSDFESAFSELRSQYTGSIAVTDLSNMEDIIENFLSSEQHLANMQNYEYYYLFFFNNVKFRVYYSDIELDFKYHSVVNSSSSTSYRYSPYNNSISNANCRYINYVYNSTSNTFSVSSSKNFTLASKSYDTSASNYSGFDLCYKSLSFFCWDTFDMFLDCMYGNYDVHYYNTDEVIFSANSSNSIKMENPLTDSEIKSILEIFLESVRNSDLPEHYGRYLLTYNKVTGRYTGFVYPNYIDLGMNYFDFDENEKRFLCDYVGPYYNFIVYQEDDSYFSKLFDSISITLKKPLIYEFRSNTTNTNFRFNTTYSFLGDSSDNLDIPFLVSTLDEPIIYTSHKIYSMFFIGNDLGAPQYVYDYESSIENQTFVNSETGEFIDTSLNEFTEEENKNIDVFSFIQMLFKFIFAVVSFLIRFFTFIVSFIIVPASTTILPDGFVQGIDWLHSFAFGEIFLWDIFSILFAVLLALYIVRLIRSH